MTKTFENQMSYSPSISSCFLRHSLVSIAVIIFLIFTGIPTSVFSSILTFMVLILSTVLLFKVTKRKPNLVRNQAKDEVVSASCKYLPETEEVVHKVLLENEDVSQRKETQEGEEVQIHDYVTGLPGLLSESESVDHSSTSEDPEVYWPFPGEVGQIRACLDDSIRACSDDSISDDDSLIEIELPEGHYVGPKEETNLKSPPNLPEFLPDSIFQQQGLMELLAEINEMNEEENLIEIDISVGSIKCSRLEIEA